jgi:probable rRNA maturation factor
LPSKRRPGSVRVVVLDATRARAGAGLARWLEAIAPARAHGEVTVLLGGDSRIRRLNRRFRGTDAVTDVISFPMASDDPDIGPPRRSPLTTAPFGRSRRQAPGAGLPPLGDIAISVAAARRQARAAGHALATELRVLALHGLLHLLGYDHEHDGGRMARVERRLRRQGGLPAGLLERRR